MRQLQTFYRGCQRLVLKVLRHAQNGTIIQERCGKKWHDILVACSADHARALGSAVYNLILSEDVLKAGSFEADVSVAEGFRCLLQRSLEVMEEVTMRIWPFITVLFCLFGIFVKLACISNSTLYRGNIGGINIFFFVTVPRSLRRTRDGS